MGADCRTGRVLPTDASRRLTNSHPHHPRQAKTPFTCEWMEHMVGSDDQRLKCDANYESNVSSSVDVGRNARSTRFIQDATSNISNKKHPLKDLIPDTCWSAAYCPSHLRFAGLMLMAPELATSLSIGLVHLDASWLQPNVYSIRSTELPSCTSPSHRSLHESLQDSPLADLTCRKAHVPPRTRRGDGTHTRVKSCKGQLKY